MNFLHIAFLFFGTALMSFAATGFMLRVLKRKGIVDTPNERSSHQIPTPRGGGMAVILVILATAGLSFGEALSGYLWLFIATLLLAGICWIDDLKGLTARLRLLSQFIAVGLVFWAMPTSSPYFHGLLPAWLDSFIAIILWVWFINLFNFMDGIDGITAVEASSIGLGLFLLMILGASQITHGLLGLVIAAAALGFLWWNWHPAKLFLGDVGSVPLGFLLGWMLLQVLASPLWLIALILPLYYLADATLTLLRRGFKGERVWLPHREHFYQQATGRGLSHAHVTLVIAGVNIVLIGWAFLSLSQPLFAGIGAALSVASALLYLRDTK